MNVCEVWFLVSVYLIKAYLIDVVESGESCVLVNTKCYRRTGCRMALQNFFDVCSSVIEGESRGCTVGCKRALISLLTTEDRAGRAYMNCDCRDDKKCLEQKRRVEVCKSDVLAELDSVDDNTTRVSCTLARFTCQADTSCFAALGFYTENCRRLMMGDKCTPRCNNSLNVLHQQFKARKLQTCTCDGTEPYDCERIKEFTEELCYNRPYHVKKHRPHPPDCVNSAYSRCDSLLTNTAANHRWLFCFGQLLFILILLQINRTNWL
ncbi:growth arrest-specific protein 1 [Octopus bimaculoides]|uniref:GDNF/GAS1 domain-containing protein n=1 Tax=Octopus bimaculoides TaxID=37653 RepID=A0A0L8FF55_OCTBM|nr:growth arrest-specific protein 1 [Octopus bimaculoides]|eukprot:XP_014790349.1 PREDICTED: growth arrest-specific protein 1-like [Octopus bimaculoides]